MTIESREQDHGSSRASRKSRGSPAIIEAGGSGAELTDAQIKHMANRFLGWRLPENFHPDAGITFKAEYNEHTKWPMKHQPIGTNLFDADQAEAMVRHMIEGLPEPAELDAVGAAERDVGRWAYRRIEALMAAKPDTPEAAELAWLAEVVESIEEYGSEACADTALAALPVLSAAPERVEGGGWRPIAEARGKPGTYINVRSVTTYRWLEYKPDGKRQMRRDGRWQKAVGDYGGWQNEELPERGEFRPNLPVSASPPIGAEGGRDGLAGDSGCGEGTQEPSPSGAQSDDGRGEL